MGTGEPTTDSTRADYAVWLLGRRVRRLEEQLELLHKQAAEPMNCLRRFFERHAEEKKEDE
jgi:hypothetical protein